MNNKLSRKSISIQEIIFQFILNILAFVFYSFDKHNPQIALHQIVFFINYATIAFLINYVFLPKFFYQKKYIQFSLIIILLTSISIIIEEFVLEQIFFPDTRGRKFAGMFYTLLNGMPVITMLSGFKFAWDALMKQHEVEKLEAAIKDSELRFLKSQINPHFLFNNLNNLYAYAIEKSPKTPEIILELSAVLRYMLYECKEKFVLLEKEIELIHHYMQLNELQIEDRGKIHFTKRNIDGSFYIAPIILIVFIENAYKHSTASQTKDILIDVEVELTPNGVLKFICKNSFQQLSNTNDLSSGIGLENVKKRLQLIYPNAHELKIIRGDETFEVYLSINLHEVI
ncbi:sensor histidine kinase [Saccharicrinis fermentans]|uniref:Putative sensor-like histidine kinase YehU n=1 Tax=Saccharicrinis fermentans DSM 9555 = JCM 21142 TaxID=869213 RepID=W7Y127_9BACT|nr:histidine kinase [Saccharicrinis fermentans]GAF04625.1 putative sensor-like histidine kinase YehU [Saccharicrinis fermentans DSM 9555 = JCM 21142]